MSIQERKRIRRPAGSVVRSESGLGVILGSPASTQEFSHRVLQYDRWMQSPLQRDPDVGLYLLFQLAGNSPVGYSASHALVCAVLCHLIAIERGIDKPERDSLVHAALTMNIAMTAMQDALATQVEKPTPEQQDAIRLHASKGALMLGNLRVTDTHWLQIVSGHHDTAIDKADLRSAPPVTRLTRILKASRPLCRDDQPPYVTRGSVGYRICPISNCQRIGQN